MKRGLLLASAVLAFTSTACSDAGSNASSQGTVAGSCKVDADCGFLDDGDACNGNFRCDAALGSCRFDGSTVVVCDAANDTSCLANVCAPTTGACSLVPRNEGAICDDGEPCTLGDRCTSGSCKAGETDLCACHKDADCADDGNLCNGTEFCDVKAFPHACKVNPATIVTCPDDDEPCKANLCDPKTGSCVLAPLADGSACDDGDACTSSDVCTGGGCKGGANTCTCKVDSDCVDDDGDPCTGVPYCDANAVDDKGNPAPVCKTNPASVIQCSTAADTDCRKNVCDKALGACKLTPVADKTGCDDGDSCTTGEICAGGVCAGGTDTCKCSGDADCKGADDGNLCNGLPYCNLANGKCETNPATVVICPTVDDTACAKNVCQPKTGVCEVLPRAEVKQLGCQAVDLGGGVVAQFCLYAPKQAGEAGDGSTFVCEDGNSCTKGDVCEGKACKSGAAVCECSSDEECASKDDGNLCNGTMFCNGQTGKCEINPSSIVTCPSVDDTTCLKNVCAPKTGLCSAQAAPGGTPCDDGDICTGGDVCKLGTCTAGPTATCECQNDLDCVAKDDGNLCNGVMICDKSGLAKGEKPVCKLNEASIVTCPSVGDTDCTKNKCNPKLGLCQPTPVSDGSTCDDGNVCTKGDACTAGACAPGTFTCACKTDQDCAAKDDGNLCNGVPYCDKTGAEPVCKVNPSTIVTCPNADDTACMKNLCAPKTGVCGPTASAPGTSCDDGDACTSGDVCKLGLCTAGTFTCECQQDADCASKDDGNACNGVLFCDKSGSKPACAPLPNSAVFCSKSDDTECLKSQCDPKTAKCSLQPVKAGTACDDEKPCTVGETCANGLCGSGKVNGCDDGDACTVDSCDAKLGCQHAAKSCTDGNECTVEGCDAKTGNCTAPKPADKGALCNGDNKGCTVGDACDGAGACAIGSAVACKQPADPCKEALCQDKGGSDYLCVEATRKDGSDCDKDGSCKVGAVCKAGACLPATTDTFYADATFGVSGGWTELRAIAPTKGRDAYVGGRTRAKVGNNASTNVAFVQRISHVATTLWEKTFVGDAAHADTMVVQLAATPDDGVLALAQVKLNSNASPQPRIFKLAASNGAVQWNHTPGVASGYASTTPLALAVDASGIAAFAMRDDKACGAQTCGALRVRVLSSSGAATATWPRTPDTTIFETFHGFNLAFRDASTIFASGTRSEIAKNQSVRAYYAWDTTLSSAGSEVAPGKPTAGSNSVETISLLIAPSDAYKTRLVSLAETKKATLEVGLEASSGDEEQIYLHTIAGKVARFASGKGGVILVGGALGDGSTPDLYAGLVDKRGNQLWSTRIDSGANDVIGDVAFAADGSMWVAGTVYQGNNARGSLSRLSPFGHATCSGAGVCFGKTWSDCDDNAVCTVDGCNGTAGCQHTLKNGVACDVSNGCSVAAFCASGSCVPTPDGDIRSNGEGPVEKGNVVRGPYAVPSIDGDESYGVFGVEGGQTKATAWTTTPDLVFGFDAAIPAATATNGLPTFEADFGLARPSSATKPLPDDVLVWGTDVVNGRASPVFARRGGQTWVHKIGATSTYQGWARDMIEAANGETWVVSRANVSGNYSIDVWRLTTKGSNGTTGAMNHFVVALSNLPQEDYADVDARGDGGLSMLIQRSAGLNKGSLTIRSTLYNCSVKYSLDVKAAGDLRATAIAALGDGGAVAAGTLEDPSSLLQSGYLTKIDGAGKVLWYSLAATPDGREYSSLLPLVDRIVVGGTTFATKTKTLTSFLGAIDHAGSWQWERDYGKASGTATGLAERSDGGVMFATIHRLPNTTLDRIRLIKTNPWGHTDCITAGVCSAKGLDDCDDSNACTVDVCDAKNGCSHTKTSGGVCATGKVCKNGVCSVP